MGPPHAAPLVGGISILLLVLGVSGQNVQVGVDLVTKLSNNWVPIVIKEISKQNENVITSPFGLMSNLAMVLEATGGKTREEFFQALNMTHQDVANLRNGFKAYCDLFLKFSSDPEAAGSFNAGALTTSFKVDATYRNTLERYYCANVNERPDEADMSFEASSIAGVMSHWKDYEKLSVYTFLSHRSMTPFRRRDGSTVQVPMIPQVGVFKGGYWENSNVILLPLQAKLVDLLIILPERPELLDVVVKKVAEYSLPLLVHSLQRQELEVFLPQMTIVNKNFNFNSMLIRHGFRRVFDETKANLTAAASSSAPQESSKNETTTIHLTKVEQNAFFSTSFVAVNSVSGTNTRLEKRRRSRRQATSVYVDRPFLFFIVHKDTQLAMLAGKVENPLQVPHSQ